MIIFQDWFKLLSVSFQSRCPVFDLMSELTLFTNKIPHHAAHSGYEQLIHHITADDVMVRQRHSDTKLWQRNVARVLRRAAASRWYMWDGVEAEYRVIRKASQKESMQVAHFLYGDTSVGMLPYIKRWLNLKLILTIHACPDDLDEILQYPGLLKSVDRFILLGSNQKPFFLDHGIESERLKIIPHGVDTRYFTPMDEENDDDGHKNRPFRLLIVGNWRRNFVFYRKVIGKLNRESMDVEVNVVTAPHHREEFGSLSNVHIHHDIDDRELLRLYQTSDLLLMGVEDAVANNVILEAMACGLPLISEDVGAIGEYLGESGILVDSNDADQAVYKIQEFVENPDKLVRQSEAVRKRALDFDWPRIAEETKKVYRDLGWNN